MVPVQSRPPARDHVPQREVDGVGPYVSHTRADVIDGTGVVLDHVPAESPRPPSLSLRRTPPGSTPLSGPSPTPRRPVVARGVERDVLQKLSVEILSVHVATTHNCNFGLAG